MNFDDIGSILSSMSEDDLSSLSDMAQQFFGGESGAPEPQNHPLGGIDPQLISKIMQVMPLLQTKGDDERTRLIAALKPLLSPQRRRKADEAIQLMRLIDILPVIEKLM